MTGAEKARALGASAPDTAPLAIALAALARIASAPAPEPMTRSDYRAALQERRDLAQETVERIEDLA